MHGSAFSDDFAILAVGNIVEDTENMTKYTLGKVSIWLKENSVKIVEDKTQAIMLIGRKNIRNANFMVKGAR